MVNCSTSSCSKASFIGPLLKVPSMCVKAAKVVKRYLCCPHHLMVVHSQLVFPCYMHVGSNTAALCPLYFLSCVPASLIYLVRTRKTNTPKVSRDRGAYFKDFGIKTTLGRGDKGT